MLITKLLFIGIFGVASVIGQSVIEVDDTKIVGGHLVTNRSDFAYQVSLRSGSRNRHFCGGTIVGRRVVLCASHCFQDRDTSPGAIRAVVGDLNVYEPSNDTSVHYNRAVITNQAFNITSYVDDVALVIIQDEFTWSSKVNFVPLALVRPEPGSNCTISGWGSVISGGGVVDDLRYVNVLIISTQECSTNYGQGRITPGMMCAGSMQGGIDSCQGDSGGPLVCDGSVAGIVSWGRGCARNGYPGVYTDVAYYNDWIENALTNYFANENITITTTISPPATAYTTPSPPDINTTPSPPDINTTPSPTDINTTPSPPDISTTPSPSDNTNPPISTEGPPATTNAPPPDNSSVSYVVSLQLLVAIFVFNCILS